MHFNTFMYYSENIAKTVILQLEYHAFTNKYKLFKYHYNFILMSCICNMPLDESDVT